ncbi:excalibur calcium-binding domain-containing protein [Streptomyces sp. H27-H1]|uniref:excalibur calcium-binding domain-containing protein n=1 Tax=Streptomyces sp. H27-H1 TaxID=2996461 RepID=UPI00226F38C8|nr:excalibur calcium-binding domain-containing protein [Streptomyces sp. H27-H1]MCY0931274.1 excalibur calcium-binding domain-containing protein [Streptomyces sp. H27-H1]
MDVHRAGTPSGPPNPVGRNLKGAQAAAVAAGFKSISHDAGPGDTGQWADGNWKACFQALADKPVGKQTTIDFAVTRNEWPCPGTDGDPIPSSSGGGGSVYYKNCDAAKAANAAPIRRGEPGYRNALDRDGDGIACDRITPLSRRACAGVTMEMFGFKAPEHHPGQLRARR